MVGSVCVNDLICVHLQVHCSNCHCVLVEHKSYEVTKPRCDNNSYLGQRKGSHCCVAIYPNSKVFCRPEDMLKHLFESLSRAVKRLID